MHCYQCVHFFQCEKSLHHWSYVLNSSLAQSWNRITVKIWCQYLQYLQSFLEIFISHLAAAVPLLEIDKISLVCQLSSYYSYDPVPDPHVGFCSVGSPHAGHILEWAIWQQIVCYYPCQWHHIDQFSICTLTLVCAFAASTFCQCCARPSARCSRPLNTVNWQHFDCSQFNGSLSALSVALISFTLCLRLENTRNWAEWLEKSIFSQFLLGLPPPWFQA